jgi:hypothetical protein
MSIYDPILNELTTQRNYRSPMSDYGQQLLRAQIPVRSGAGFWKNLASQLVPDLVGLGIGYMGDRQEESRYRDTAAQLLPILEKQGGSDVIQSLKDVGRDDLAASVLLESRNQDALLQAEKAKLDAKWAYDERKMDKEFAGKKILEAMKGARIGSNSAANRAAQIEAARIGAEAAKMSALVNAAQNTEFKLDAEARKDPNVKAYNESLYLADTLQRLATRQELSGVDLIGAQKTLSQLIRQEAINEGDIAQIEAAGGLDGYVDKRVSYLMNQGRRDPSVIEPYLGLAKDLVEARRTQAERSIGDTRRRAAEYKKVNPYLDPVRVGPELAPNPLAVQIAKELPKGVQPVIMPKTSVPTVPSSAKEGDIVVVDGKKYRVSR